MHPIAHFKTITRHRHLVMRYCFRLGLYRQGLAHDLSKYMPIEFFRGAKYYDGTRSPNDVERRTTGYSYAWLHHKGRNRHHFEYWVDYCVHENGLAYMEGCEMPLKYVAEMFCDRVAASKVYRKEQYADGDPLAFFERSKGRIIMNENTAQLLEAMLRKLSDEGEEAAFAYVRSLLQAEKNQKEVS